LVFDLAEPVVTPAPGPDELAVPALLMPGGGGAASLDALPAPLGSLPELFSPPAFAGPDGTPLTPDVPRPPIPRWASQRRCRCRQKARWRRRRRVRRLRRPRFARGRSWARSRLLLPSSRP